MRHYLLAEVGLMRNVSPTSAIGVTIWGGYDFGYEATRFGISAHQRRWLSPGRSVEGSLGLAYTFQGPARSVAAALGAAGRIDWNLGDLVTFGLRVEWIPEGARCPPQYAASYSCYASILIAETPDHILYQEVDATERLRVWQVYAAAGLGSKAGRVTWLAAGLVGILGAAMGDCCSTAW